MINAQNHFAERCPLCKASYYLTATTYLAILDDFPDRSNLKALLSNELILHLTSDCYTNLICKSENTLGRQETDHHSTLSIKAIT